MVKRAAERLLGSRRGFAIACTIRPSSGVVLAYHNIVDAEHHEGDLSLHLPIETFLQQIDWLIDAYEVVSLPTFLDGQAGTRPRAVITFDDAYQGAMRLGLPALLERRLPATVFVVSSWIGGETTWWDALAGYDGLLDSIRHEALSRCSGLNAAVMNWSLSQGIIPAEVSKDRLIASHDTIRQCAANPLVSIAMHSHTHANLCTLGDVELAEELASSFRQTRRAFSDVLPWLAFPYGLSDARVVEATRRAGYEGALLVSGGPVRSIQHLDRFAVPRVNVPNGLSLAGLRMRAAGIR